MPKPDGVLAFLGLASIALIGAPSAADEPPPETGGARVEGAEPTPVGAYRLDCAAGSATACNNLGVIFAAGKVVATDERQAVRLFDTACRGDLALGCANLGWMVYGGRGVPLDPKRAAALFQSACAAGEVHGCKGLEKSIVPAVLLGFLPGGGLIYAEQYDDAALLATAVALFAGAAVRDGGEWVRIFEEELGFNGWAPFSPLLYFTLVMSNLPLNDLAGTVIGWAGWAATRRYNQRLRGEELSAPSFVTLGATFPPGMRLELRGGDAGFSTFVTASTWWPIGGGRGFSTGTGIQYRFQLDGAGRHDLRLFTTPLGLTVENDSTDDPTVGFVASGLSYRWRGPVVVELGAVAPLVWYTPPEYGWLSATHGAPSEHWYRGAPPFQAFLSVGTEDTPAQSEAQP